MKCEYGEEQLNHKYAFKIPHHVFMGTVKNMIKLGYIQISDRVIE